MPRRNQSQLVADRKTSSNSSLRFCYLCIAVTRSAFGKLIPDSSYFGKNVSPLFSAIRLV